jgi:hypothetical protein
VYLGILGLWVGVNVVVSEGLWLGPGVVGEFVVLVVHDITDNNDVKKSIENKTRIINAVLTSQI